MDVKKFAQGYNLYKLIWIFLISSFIGACIEIVWCYFAMGKLMSRKQSFIWPIFCCMGVWLCFINDFTA